MFALVQLYITVGLALHAAASSIVARNAPITIPIARRFNASGPKTVLERDQFRAKTLKQSVNAGASAGPSVNATTGLNTSTGLNAPIANGAVSYTAEIQVGDPPQNFTLLVDTGSSNTWVGADPNNPYVPTNTSSSAGGSVAVTYGSGFFFGLLYTDIVTIGDLQVLNQSIGGAELSFGLDGIDGVLGLGPTDLTNDTTPEGGLIPTITDTAFSSHKIDAKKVGISFAPATNDSVTNGEITFGGIDDSKFNGSLSLVDITSTSPSSGYVGINQSITYGESGDGAPILANTAGIVDTGTTMVLLATDAYNTYLTATGATLDETTGFLSISTTDYDKLKSLFFQIGNTSYELTANGQTWPRSLNEAIGGDANSIYLIVGDLGSPSGEGMDFINGYAFLERYYHVYDSEHNQVGFAPTQYTFATTN